MPVIDPGLVAAFQGNPDRDVGRKLETTVFLHVRRERSLRAGAKGLLLYHEFNPALVAKLPNAKPAWRWLLERNQRKRSS